MGTSMDATVISNLRQARGLLAQTGMWCPGGLFARNARGDKRSPMPRCALGALLTHEQIVRDYYTGYRLYALLAETRAVEIAYLEAAALVLMPQDEDADKLPRDSFDPLNRIVLFNDSFLDDEDFEEDRHARVLKMYDMAIANAERDLAAQTFDPAAVTVKERDLAVAGD